MGCVCGQICVARLARICRAVFIEYVIIDVINVIAVIAVVANEDKVRLEIVAAKLNSLEGIGG